MTWSLDGKHIITGGEMAGVRVWLVDIEDVLTLARSLIQRDPPTLTSEERERYGLDEQPKN